MSSSSSSSNSSPSPPLPPSPPPASNSSGVPNSTWICEACGCHTNIVDSASCAICGTRQMNRFALLRRVGPARVVHQPLTGVTSSSNNNRNNTYNNIHNPNNRNYSNRHDDNDYYDDDDVEDFEDEEDEQANAAWGSIHHVRRRPNPPSSSSAQAPVIFSTVVQAAATDLLDKARINSESTNDPYTPKWSAAPGDIFTISSPPDSSSSCITSSSSPSPSSPSFIPPPTIGNIATLKSGAGEGRSVRTLLPIPISNNLSPTSKVIGWKILFEHPTRGKGKSMGGCYLAGVTAAHETAAAERGLQQSRQFWGVEDGGRWFEGRRQHGRQLNRNEAIRNADDVLFGNLDEVIIVADMEKRTLSYWRNGTFIGTLVNNLPRVDLYPASVPFNAGVKVVICGLHEDPLAILTAFHEEQKRVKAKEELDKKAKLEKEKAILIHPLTSELTDELKSVLYKICGMYSTPNLDIISATRLWYSFGFKLSQLNLLLKNKNDDVSADDFVNIVTNLVREEEEKSPSLDESNESITTPLLNSRIQSVRSSVLDSGSGSMRMLKGILRVHGFDSNLNQISGTSVDASSWMVGDWVIQQATSSAASSSSASSASASFLALSRASNPTKSTIMARIITDRDTECIALETVEGTRRLRAVDGKFDLTHSTILHGNSMLPNNKNAVSSKIAPMDAGSDDAADDDDGANSIASKEMTNKVKGVARLDRTTISFVIKDASSISVLASYFAAGLPKAIIDALELISSSDSSSTSEAVILLICKLAVKIVEMLSGGDKHATSSSSTSSSSSSSSASTLANAYVRAPGSASTSASLSIRDFIMSDMRDAGFDISADSEHREILLSLMASARMNDDSSSSMVAARLSVAANSNTAAVALSRALEGLQRNATSTTSTWSELRSLMRSASTRKISGATLMLIQNGIMFDSVEWMRRSFLMGADAKGVDEDGYPCLLIAISIGSSIEVINSIVLSGGVVGNKEIEAAAISGQPLVLKKLLKHALYDEGSFDHSICSVAVKAILKTNLEQQQSKMAEMQKSAPKFMSTLLEVLVQIALTFSSADGGAKKKKEVVLDALVGDILFHVVAEGASGPLIMQNTKRSTSTALSFATSSSSSSSASCSTAASTASTASDANAPTHPNKSLLHFFKSEVFERMPYSSLTLYLRLMEAHLWSKNVRDVAIGLSLATILLNKDVSRCDGMQRYGVSEMALKHVQLAKDNLGEEEGAVKVECPRGHNCSLHLTNHSSYHCDLCGRGVEVNMPMHGCRSCDWDACQSCIGKKSGGPLKWTFVLNTARAVASRFPLEQPPTAWAYDLPGFNEFNSGLEFEETNKLRGLSEKLAKRNSDDDFTRDLSRPSPLRKKMRRSAPSSDDDFISPPSYQLPTDQCNGEEFLNYVVECCFNSKKNPGNGGGDNADGRGDGVEAGEDDDSEIRQEYEFRLGDIVSISDDYIELMNSRGISLGPMASGDTGTVVDITPGRVFVDYRGVLWHYLKSALILEEEGSRAGSTRSKARKKKECPPIVKIIHTILAFEERVQVITNNSPEFSDLQSLLVPFQVKLRRASDTVVCGEELSKDKDSDRLNNVSANQSGGSQQKRKKKDKQKGKKEAAAKKMALALPPRRAPSNSCSDLRCHVHVEPLMPMTELQKHILRICRIKIPEYIEFARNLAVDRVIIADRPLCSAAEGDADDAADDLALDPSGYLFEEVEGEGGGGVVWGQRSVARIVAYDHNSGTHIVRYASRIKRRDFDMNADDDEDDIDNVEDILEFNGFEARLVLAARDYVLLYRDSGGSECDDEYGFAAASEDDNSEFTRRGRSASALFSPSRPPAAVEIDHQLNSTTVGEDFALLIPVGTRIESDIAGDGGDWMVYTIVSGSVSRPAYSPPPMMLDDEDGGDDEEDDEDDDEYEQIRAESNVSCKYSLVSESGVYFSNVPESQLRGRDLSLRTEDEGAGAGAGSASSRSFGSGGARSMPSNLTIPTVMKRQWSALTSAVHSRPLSLAGRKAKAGQIPGVLVKSLEMPPCLIVEFSISEELAPCNHDNKHTLFHYLQTLRGNQLKGGGAATVSSLNRCATLHYNVDMKQADSSSANPSNNDIVIESVKVKGQKGGKNKKNATDVPAIKDPLCGSPNRTKTTLKVDSFDKDLSSCAGVNSTCLLCLDVLNILAHSQPDSDIFSSSALTAKLLEQLEDPLSVVSGALPEWTKILPAASPYAFTHGSRRLLIERGNFGVSRAVFKQQENKVNVASLKTRMESIRQRAIALMNEAFSEDAEDPMALQLQADELYNLEEQLKAQVASAFKRQRWIEHSLQSAKATVNRERLIEDADAIMEVYSTSVRANRRRLEVNFENESGFDASSGESAGVTRGFYGDIAMKLMESQEGALWIQDVDSGESNIIIATPRASKTSQPGLFPRPIEKGGSEHELVYKRFKMLGRLFAAALRDNFLVPLPLSHEFLKLVQNAEEEAERGEGLKKKEELESSNEELEEVTAGLSGGGGGGGFGFEEEIILKSGDLPRPGFLGGEIYAMERFIDKHDAANSNKEKEELERGFAREFMGYTYDYSFSQFVEGRVFVDVFDTSQKKGFELCLGGANLAVTIENLREYVNLQKRWMLHTGVIAQTLAFREGVNDFFDWRVLRLLTVKELRDDICGDDTVDNWDEAKIKSLFKLDGGKESVESMATVAGIGGDGGNSLSRRFSNNSLTFGFLIKALLEASVNSRRRFLTFATSLPISTPSKIELTPIVNSGGEFVSVSEVVLPRSNTCSRMVYLPKFQDYKQFVRIFWSVVDTNYESFHEVQS